MPTLTNPQNQHAIGALLGSAVGDALGAPFEFQPGGRYSARFPRRVLGGAGEMVGGGPWAPGEFTDDTHMALALAESLVSHGRLHPEDLWARWRAWAADAKDVGILTRQALSCSTHDGAAAHAHRANGGKSAGNGSLMRNVPVALFHHDSPPDEIHALAAAHSALTHHDPDCAVACGLHARMVRAALYGDCAFAALDEAVAELPTGPRARWSALLRPAWKPSDAKPQLTNGTVWICMAQAVWAVRGARSFADALIRAIDLGGDADTVACVAGSIAGARWGIQGIPSRWTTYVHGAFDTPAGRRSYANGDLQRLACRLLG